MKLIILDRDGVINQDSPGYIKSPDEWHAIPGSLQAIARLHQAGWTVAIASNQSGLARGLFDISALTAIHLKLRKELAQLSGAEDGCMCRKPLPGLFHDIARRYDVDLSDVPTVGDSLRDIQAGATAGCRPWLVQTGNGPKTLKQGNLPPNTQVVQNLAEAVDKILSNAQ